MGTRSGWLAPTLALAAGSAGAVAALLPWAYFSAFHFRAQTERLAHSPLKWTTITASAVLVVLGLVTTISRRDVRLPIGFIVAGAIYLGCGVGSIIGTLVNNRNIHNELGPYQGAKVGYGVGVLAAIGLASLAIGLVLQLSQPAPAQSRQ